MQISKSRFKSRALEHFRHVEETGEDLIITDHGRSTIRVTRYVPNQRDPLRMLRGTVKRYVDPEQPVADDDWEAGR
ncbi:antitoxin (DNA-binding transcriptional repressor) of toxin-antitoxin stability system [Methylohalomonas lacus]|uniref:Antitoxin (DNA-binding transcriptional repressor) of toxin-antitoxin stability system n=1 Tax=Methylohalomonas lacus TaxID=398773 RepID=A0AAE3L626_9GAMM|nr:type II toxin-antitoxin system Phd/YefM family antitoxin [Methylohalomonas lacus]MCS3904512.1 antitoxin (DNA-binding transcriptional repressor) of toxin-antitoxin stability system [Methylohalomonas lacus]